MCNNVGTFLQKCNNVVSYHGAIDIGIGVLANINSFQPKKKHKLRVETDERLKCEGMVIFLQSQMGQY